MLKQKKLSNSPFFSVDQLVKEIEDCLSEFEVIGREKTASPSTVKEGGQAKEDNMEPDRLSTSTSFKEGASQNDASPGDSVTVTVLPSIVPASTFCQNASEGKGNEPYFRLNKKLRAMEDYRKKNELIFGYKQNEKEKKIGLRAFNDPDKNESKIRVSLESTATYSYLNTRPSEEIKTVSLGLQETMYTEFGVAEFAISYDNQIFLYRADLANSDTSFVINHLTIGYGTFLKAVGLIKIEEGQIKYISSFSSAFDVESDAELILALAIFEKAGFDLSNTKIIIPDRTGPLVSGENGNEGCRLSFRGWTRDFNDYAIPGVPGLLDVQRFPRIKAKAEDTRLVTVIREVLLNIDDDLLGSHHVFLRLQDLRQELKCLIVDLIKGSEAYDFFSRYNLISKKLEGLEDVVNFNLTKRNLYSLLLWKSQGGKLADEDKQEIDGWFSSPGQKEVPGRAVIRSKNYTYYLSFYRKNPQETFIALLRDYIKDIGFLGWLKRTFYGAWNRHYVKPVTQFLVAYHHNEYLDDLTICDMLNIIKDYSSIESFSDKGTLISRALFCAALNNESDDFYRLLHSTVDCISPPLFVLEPTQEARSEDNPVVSSSFSLFDTKKSARQDKKSASFNEHSSSSEKELPSETKQGVGLTRSPSGSLS